jgi:hypothetical protein
MRIASPDAQSHNLAEASDDAVTKYAASTEKTQSQTHRWCPFKTRSNVNPSKFHSFTVLSLLAVANKRPSGDNKHFNTYASCAWSFLNGSKCAVVFAPLWSFQT